MTETVHLKAQILQSSEKSRRSARVLHGSSGPSSCRIPEPAAPDSPLVCSSLAATALPEVCGWNLYSGPRGPAARTKACGGHHSPCDPGRGSRTGAGARPWPPCGPDPGRPGRHPQSRARIARRRLGRGTTARARLGEQGPATAAAAGRCGSDRCTRVGRC